LSRACFGSLRIDTRSSMLKSDALAITGSRPINSGISPNFIKSSDSTLRRGSFKSSSSAAFTNLSNPIEPFLPILSCTTLSKPTKAPEQINRIFVVSISYEPAPNLFEPAPGLTLTVTFVPSNILNRPFIKYFSIYLVELPHQTHPFG
jgi:hypothetical protein